MRSETIDGLTVLRFETLPSNVRCVVSTRVGGASKEPYDSLNLGLHVGDDDGRVIENRRKLAAAAGVPFDRFVVGEQVHETSVRMVDRDDAGRGASSWLDGLPKTDGLITNAPTVPLLCLTADCAPVVLYDHPNRAAGLLHCSWRTTMGGIIRRAAVLMRTEYGTDPRDLVVGIGPCICAERYEVGADVRKAFEDAWGGEASAHFTDHGERYLFDLRGAISANLKRMGVPAEAIEDSGKCTAEQTDLFYSYRADGPDTGRFGTLLMLER